MSKSVGILVSAAGLLLLGLGSPSYADMTRIEYALTDVAEQAGDTDRWMFEYTVFNLELASLDDFVINFEFGPGIDPEIRSLVVEADVAGWTEEVYEPSAIQLGGMFEAWAETSGLAAGEQLGGFRVSFDWLGAGLPPGSQLYEIYDAGFNVIDSGWTVAGGPVVPAPPAVVLALIGLSLCGVGKKSLLRLIGRA